jgi:hypothetical protein
VLIDLQEMAMIDGLNEYLEHIKQSYTNWWTANGQTEMTDIQKEMAKDFEASVRYEVGRKYIKVIGNSAVHSFVCLNDSGKFRKGDILMAAGWASPATNFARGNVVDRNFAKTRWTGA